MPQLGYRRGRGGRVHGFRTAGRPFAEALEALRNRSVLLRLLLCTLGVVALVIAVHPGRLPFAYRLGQHAYHGIAARLDFERPNPVATERAREMAAAQVAHIFRHDPAPLKRLPGQLKAALKQVADAKSLADVPLATRTALGLVPLSPAQGGGTPKTQTQLERDFNQLKTQLSQPGQLEQLETDFRDFLSPVLRTGLLTSPLPADIRPTDTLAVQEGARHRALVLPPDIQLSQLLSPTGALGEAWERFPALAAIRPVAEEWLKNASGAGTLVYDEQATQAAREQSRESVAEVKDVYHKGNLLVNPGDVIDEEHLSLLLAEYDAVENHVSAVQRGLRIATIALLFVVLAVVQGFYIVRSEPVLAQSASRLSVYLTAVVLAVALSHWLSFDPWRAEVIPLIATVMVLAIAYNPVLATLTGFSLTLVTALATGADLSHFVVLLAASTLVAIPVSRVSSRGTLIGVGFAAGLAYFLLSWSMGLIVCQSFRELVHDQALLIESLRGAGWCVAAGFLAAGSLPFIESAFGVVTNISLLELGDISHPLLQELVRRAPGTYNHSITVASLAETAAESIGANGLLCRVGAYFHDIGKMLKPHYFVENMMHGAESRHQQLNPAMSTLIIIGHVKDGADLAEQHGLPRPITDFIEQHHGTTLVEYFYHEATKQADKDHRTDVQESAFRYPGPKPQSREAGVLMLADAVEGASRTLSEPTPSRIERLVRDITMKRLLDGQFEESSLTMTEIHAIQASLVKSLLGIYHGRIKYPEQKIA